MTAASEVSLWLRDLSNGVRWAEMLGNPAAHCKNKEGALTVTRSWAFLVVASIFYLWAMVWVFYGGMRNWCLLYVHGCPRGRLINIYIPPCQTLEETPVEMSTLVESVVPQRRLHFKVWWIAKQDTQFKMQVEMSGCRNVAQLLHMCTSRGPTI